MRIYAQMRDLVHPGQILSHMLTLSHTPQTVGGLLDETVEAMLAMRRAKLSSAAPPKMEFRAEKILFGAVYQNALPTLAKAQATVRQAFADGLIRVIIQGEPAHQLTQSLAAKDGLEVTFLRLTLLRGFW